MATKGFTKIDNSIIFDMDLSLEALGLYIKLKHLATIDNFRIKRDYIKSISGYGETAFRRVWKELKEKCLLIEKKTRNKGRYEYTYTLKSEENIKSSKPKKKEKAHSDGNAAIKGQVHISELIESSNLHKVEEISKKTGFTDAQSADLLKAADNDVIKVDECYKYASSKNNIKNIFNYTKWAIKNNKRYIEIKTNDYKESIFNRFPQRTYDFKSLEKSLIYGEPYKPIKI